MFSVNNFSSINSFIGYVLSSIDSVEDKNRIVLDFIKNSVIDLENKLHQSARGFFSFQLDILNTRISELNKNIASGTDNETLKNEIEAIKVNFCEFIIVKSKLKAAGMYEDSKEIIESLNLASLPIAVSLGLCHEILDLEQGAHLAAQTIAQEFHNLGMNRITVEQRLALIEKMAEKGGEAAAPALVNYLCNTGLLETNNEQRLKLFHFLITHGAASEVIKHYKELGLEEASSRERFELCLMIAEQGVDATFSLILAFETIDLDIDQRLKLYTKIIEQNDAQLLIHSIKTLHLSDATLDQRLELYMKMIKHPGSAVMLAYKLDKLSLEDATVQQRLDLCLAILDSCLQIPGSGDSAVNSIIDNFVKLGLKNTTVEQRLVLCEKMSELGDRAVAAICNNFEIFGLGDATPEQRFILFSWIVSHEMISIVAMFANIHKYELDQINPSLRMKLFMKTIDQGPWGKAAILVMMENLGGLTNSSQRLELSKKFLNLGEFFVDQIILRFHKFSLDKKDTLSFFRYAAVKGLQSNFLNLVFFNRILDKSLKRQVLIDLLSPPSGLRGAFIPDLQLYGSFLTESEAAIPGRDPIIAILNKKPGELNQTDIQQFKNFLKVQSKLSFLHAFVERIEAEAELTIKRNIEKDAQKPVKEGPEKIRREAEFAKSELITWTAYVAGILFDQGDDFIAAILQTNVLDLISSYSYPSRRYTFMRAFSELSPIEVIDYYNDVTCTKSIATKQKQPTNDSTNKTRESQAAPLTQLQKPAFLLAPLTNFGLSPRKLAALQDQILNTRSMKQLSVSAALAQLLSVVTLYAPYEPEEADKIADCIIKALKQPEILGKTKKKVTLAAQEGDEKIEQETHLLKKEEQTKKDLASLMNILQIFGKNELFDFVNPENDNVSAVSFFQISFKKLFAVEEFPDFEKRYQETFGNFRDPMALFTYYKAVNRLPNDVKIVVMATLNAYVNAVLRGDFQELRSNPASSAHLQCIYTARPDLQVLWNKSLDSKTISVNEAEVKENDEKTKARFQVVETVSPCDLLMLGDIEKSCQSVYREPESNQALVSYLMNGEIRAFAIKDGNKIVARILLRLMWDEINQCPVLLQEPLYSNEDVSPAFKLALIGFVGEKANMMRLNIVAKGVPAVPYTGTVKFLGGFAPVGYCDSAGGLIPYVKPQAVSEEHEKTVAEETVKPPANAAFEVLNACLIYSPPQKSA
jgi:hypothetical protein